MRTIAVPQRCDALVALHRLAGNAASPEEVTGALVALHATDPASVDLSVLARSSTSTLADVAHSLYGTRSLVRAVEEAARRHEWIADPLARARA